MIRRYKVDILKSRVCEYVCDFHKGIVEWHHPVTSKGKIGIWLCQAHHSLLQGRRKRYSGEVIVNKTSAQMRGEIKQLELKALRRARVSKYEINKH